MGHLPIYLPAQNLYIYIKKKDVRKHLQANVDMLMLASAVCGR